MPHNCTSPNYIRIQLIENKWNYTAARQRWDCPRCINPEIVIYPVRHLIFFMVTCSPLYTTLSFLFIPFLLICDRYCAFTPLPIRAVLSRFANFSLSPTHPGISPPWQQVLIGRYHPGRASRTPFFSRRIVHSVVESVQGHG